MTEVQTALRKQTLDKDLEKLVEVEEAASVLSRSLVAPGIALLFIAVTAIFAAIAFFGEPGAVYIIAAAAVGGYMALTIGANDVANNVGPAVGARALTMGGALVIAAIFESAGALIAGGDVVDTISKGIIDPQAAAAPGIFVHLMMAALISSALWVHLATWLGAPVSTTHSIVGGVVGAGVASIGFSAVNWPVLGTIVISWVTSPLAGGIIAALVLAFIKSRIIYQDDKIKAAKLWLPLLVALMASSFTVYLATKGLHHVMTIDATRLTVIGVLVFILVWALSHWRIGIAAEHLENRNQSLRRLFRLPLIFSAALLSFAHGANDVANAVGPLAAIVAHASGDAVEADMIVSVPFWVMLIGAVGISIGLALFGPRLIRMVGEQITKLNPMRAFCVALSAAVTVIIASWFGMPVSSTHIAVGAVFGVGFFREWYTAYSPRRRAYLQRRAGENGKTFRNGHHKSDEGEEGFVPTSTDEIKRRFLVRRAHVRTIATAWVVTVPASAVLSAILFKIFDLLA